MGERSLLPWEALQQVVGSREISSARQTIRRFVSIYCNTTLRYHKKTDGSLSSLHGEMTKLVIENYLRSVPFGSKYWYETIPKIITLWLDLGMDCLGAARGEAQ